MTEDAAKRSAAALANPSAKASLSRELLALGSSIALGNVTQSRAALGRARIALEGAREQIGANPGDAPDLSAIELALIQTELALQ